MQSWQEQIKTSITDLEALLKRLSLKKQQISPELIQASKKFGVRIPESYVNRMTPGDPHDPLLLQVLPQVDELIHPQGFSADPLQEHQLSIPGLLHKYHGRVLLITRGSCAVHCRYCFRREFPYSQNSLTGEHLENALTYIAANPSIHEVILSGGDPLMSGDHQISQLIEKIEAITSIQTLRIHTRLPVVIPQRITSTLCQSLADSRLLISVVTHINHANEIDESLLNAMQRLKPSVNFLLNQSVLLKQINDRSEVLEALSHGLNRAGVLPYYLNLLDEVNGSAHFKVELEETKILMQQLLQRLPGYLVPRLVKEKPHIPYKELQHYLD